jgi:hypothetical protein
MPASSSPHRARADVGHHFGRGMARRATASGTPQPRHGRSVPDRARRGLNPSESVRPRGSSGTKWPQGRQRFGSERLRGRSYEPYRGPEPTVASAWTVPVPRPAANSNTSTIEDRCSSWGCGQDDAEPDVPVAAARVVHVAERGAGAAGRAPEAAVTHYAPGAALVEVRAPLPHVAVHVEPAPCTRPCRNGRSSLVLGRRCPSSSGSWFLRDRPLPTRALSADGRRSRPGPIRASGRKRSLHTK